MGYLNYNNVTEASGANYSISKDGTNVLFTYKNGYSYSDGKYVDRLCSPLTGNYSTALVGGLGIGTIPEWLAIEKSCNVDVVEIDNELINEISTQNYLDSKVTLVEGDINSYTSDKTYDIIVLDIWWDFYEITDSVRSTLITKYTEYLNPDGEIYFPLL